MRSGRDLADLLYGAREGLGRLQRQAVDQVGVDRLVAQFARGLHQFEHAFVGLHTVYGALHVGVEVLHAEAHPVEAERAKVRQALRRDGARVDLDRHLGPGRNAERTTERADHARQFGVRQEGGRAAAEVKLRYHRRAAECIGIQGDLGVQRVQVLTGALVVLGDDLVAGAVVAQRLAERDVNVHRQRRVRTHDGTLGALVQHAQAVMGTKGFDETVCGGVGGVAGAGGIEFAQQICRQDGFPRPGGQRSDCIHGAATVR